MSASPPPIQAFFLPTPIGQRFCLYHAPTLNKIDADLGSIVHVHAFAEEMNKCRRMAAMQARALAGLGYGVLQIDLYGCGDSSGDFADARWDIWKSDIVAGLNWLQQKHSKSLNLWGDRLGALLAMDVVRERREQINKLMLWQPVFSGEQFMTQFFRLLLANEMVSGKEQSVSGTKQIRAMLEAGETIEIAGYEIAADLAKQIDSLNAQDWLLPAGQLHWLEISNNAQNELAPARQLIADTWRQLGNSLQVHRLSGSAFWLAQETIIAPEWLNASCAIFAGAE
ncbi:hydrolase 2, exosortase A system-associated [Solimicrobium silvestre]|uniref:Exosortase A system-associated hydrolase 2 n=1 Tax=Solimicrobium silvestre TaxID=2099400 RepID=A0A2S9GT91_9BURK|nr:hydrolase 2, exosortase A system-associated [Solimicrobium silvestre]PRC90939.1 Exosortase A system-associated hydrolase 2 [Solimicrobium silvestre]